MPAAAKLMADNELAAGSVAGTGKDGRVTKGDVLGALEGGAERRAAPTPAPRSARRPRPRRQAAAGRCRSAGAGVEPAAIAPSSACR